jgi:predicted AAA+ superfamily ATPase
MNNLNKTYAFRWINSKIEEIHHIELIDESDLLYIENQKNIAKRNINNFVNNKPYLHMFLWGPRGTGKSSLIKMLLNQYKNKGLRVIEFPQESIHTIFELYKFIRANNTLFFLIFFDDISFDEDDLYFRKFKSTMEGGLEETPKNCMYVATSNKRHIIKEKANNNGEDIYNFDMINEQLSLFARFGLAIPYPVLTRKEYLEIVKFYLAKFSIKRQDNILEEAENFAIDRGGRSPRIAKQFAIYCTLK